MIRHFRYIPIPLMPAALAAGWLPTDGLAEMHHAHWSVLCEWLCGCAEAWPLEVNR